MRKVLPERWFWVWLALGSILAACGGESAGNPNRPGSGAAGGTASGSGGALGGGGAPSAAPIAIGDLCPVFTRDLCVYLMQCNGARYRDLDHCTRELDCFGMNELLAAADSGAVLYDPSLVGQCHARFLESPCTFGFFLFTPDIFEVLSWCPGTLTPKLGTGQSCVSSGECVEGLYCYKGTDWLCPGTCQARGTNGASCAGSAQCADGFRCNSDICVPDPKAGDACPGGAGCAYSVSCPADQVCPENIWCDLSVGQCQPGRLEGQACGLMSTATASYLAQCAVHLWCNSLGSGQGTCQKPNADNGPCNSQPYACAQGLHCNGYSTASLGACVGPSAAGGDCTGDDDCQTGLVCLAGACSAPAASGETCTSDGNCAPGLICSANVCRSARYPGDSCNSTDLLCAFSRCVNGTCQDYAKVGEPCQAAEDCSTGHCAAGVCYDDSVCNAP
jgi:hypothetical protein